MTILKDIIAHKKMMYSTIAETITVKDLEERANFSRDIISLSESLLDKNRTGIIAEFKRKSPSKGISN